VQTGPAPSAAAAAARILAPGGVLRVGVYQGSPTSMVRSPDGKEDRGLTVELGRALANELGVRYEQKVFTRIAEVLTATAAGEVDFTISNATPERARSVDFTQPLLALELGFLVPPGATATRLDEIDVAGKRVGVTQGSTSQATLPARLKQAAVVPVPNVRDAIAWLRDGRADAFATNKAILFEMADGLPGSRVLDERWGIEHLAVAVPKARSAAATYLEDFVARQVRSGGASAAAARAGLRGTVRPDGGG
jgi:polar amino acid transport system substrate-binding protein